MFLVDYPTLRDILAFESYYKKYKSFSIAENLTQLYWHSRAIFKS